jgi:methylmalonyl-CoA mutase N-terminal domain/subunit
MVGINMVRGLGEAFNKGGEMPQITKSKVPRTASKPHRVSKRKSASRADLAKACKEWEEGPLKTRLAPGEISPQFRCHSGITKEETKEEFRTGGGEIIVNRLYTPLDLADTDPVEDIGFPGQFPYTRGRDPLGYRAFNWSLRFYSGYGSGESANERFKALCASGSRQLTVALDLPTQNGLDSDHPMARGEVGKVGVAISTLPDMEKVFSGLPLGDLHSGTVGNCIGPWVVAMFHSLGERMGVNPQQMKIRLQNDPIKEYTGRGTYIFPPRVAVDLASDVVEYLRKYLPGWEPQYNCTTTMRWGGCSTSQEIGFGVANLMAYVEAAMERGIPPEEFVPWLTLHMTADNDLFEEAAKFRAVRRLWARLAQERFNTDDPRVLALRLTVYTGANLLTAQEPLNNVVRTTMHVLASILGGVENIATPAHDEALALPTFEAQRLGQITKIILQDESLIGQTIDPLGGSYFVESLTNKLEELGKKCYQKVEDQGGAISAIENGYYLREMAEGAYRHQREIENGQRSVIGVNKYVVEKEAPIQLFQGDPADERRQIEWLNTVRRERNQTRVNKSLAVIRRVAESKAAGRKVNIVPAMMDAVKAHATIGEIFGLLREIFGEYKPPAII